ncbi:MAG: hypothetical protein ACTHK7_15160 [Aureliella sp.]
MSCEAQGRDHEAPRSKLLFGETLSWVTYDKARTVSAGLRSLLRGALDPRGVRLEIVEATSAEEAASLVEQQRAGLLTLVLSEDDWTASSGIGSSGTGPGWAAACKALRRVQVRRGRCLRCVYVAQPEMASDLRLFEAGAQIVVDQIPWLQRLVPRIIEQAPRKSGGSHPITAGLVDRLPWPSV